LAIGGRIDRPSGGPGTPEALWEGGPSPPPSRIMDPQHALSDLKQISVQIGHAVIVDAEGRVLGSPPGPGGASARPARATRPPGARPREARGSGGRAPGPARAAAAGPGWGGPPRAGASSSPAQGPAPPSPRPPATPRGGWCSTPPRPACPRWPRAIAPPRTR